MEKMNSDDTLGISGLYELLITICQIDPEVRKLYVRVDTNNCFFVVVGVDSPKDVEEYRAIDNYLSTPFMQVYHVKDLDEVGAPLGVNAKHVTWYNASSIIKRAADEGSIEDDLKYNISITDDVGLCLMYIAQLVKMEIHSDNYSKSVITDFGASDEFLQNLYKFADAFKHCGRRAAYQFYKKLWDERKVIERYCTNRNIEFTWDWR